nr:thioredoxin H-type-like [Ipomoea batatas]GME12567.1 thioredoxin H-type-like [Ipomoea batatas]
MTALCEEDCSFAVQRGRCVSIECNGIQFRRKPSFMVNDNGELHKQVVHAQGEEWEEKMEEAKKDDKIVIVNFSASWCVPCRAIAPLYSELSEKHLSWMFLVVDVDVLSDLSSTWDIKATPTFFFLRGGQQFEKVIGANKEELQKKSLSMSSIVNATNIFPFSVFEIEKAEGSACNPSPIWLFVKL